MEQQKKKRRFFGGGVNWVRPYYKQFNSRIINQLGIVVAVLVVILIVMAYLGHTEVASRLGLVVLAVTGVLVGAVGAVQAINRHDLKEQEKAKKEK